MWQLDFMDANCAVHQCACNSDINPDQAFCVLTMHGRVGHAWYPYSMFLAMCHPDQVTTRTHNRAGPIAPSLQMPWEVATEGSHPQINQYQDCADKEVDIKIPSNNHHLCGFLSIQYGPCCPINDWMTQASGFCLWDTSKWSAQCAYEWLQTPHTMCCNALRESTSCWDVHLYVWWSLLCCHWCGWSSTIHVS